MTPSWPKAAQVVAVTDTTQIFQQTKCGQVSSLVRLHMPMPGYWAQDPCHAFVHVKFNGTWI